MNQNDQKTTDINRFKENQKKINQLAGLLKAFFIFLGITVFGLFLIAVDFWYIFLIGLVGTMLISNACSSASGHGAVDMSTLGNAGCFAFLLIPVWFAVWWFYALGGWAYAISEKNKLTSENNLIMSKYNITDPNQIDNSL